MFTLATYYDDPSHVVPTVPLHAGSDWFEDSMLAGSTFCELKIVDKVDVTGVVAVVERLYTGEPTAREAFDAIISLILACLRMKEGTKCPLALESDDVKLEIWKTLPWEHIDLTVAKNSKPDKENSSRELDTPTKGTFRVGTITNEESFIRYVGAWAFAHLRCAAKSHDLVSSFFSDTAGKNRFEDLYSGLYSGSKSYNFPPLSTDMYRDLCRRMDSGDTMVISLALRATLVAHLAMEQKKSQYSEADTILSGLAMITIFGHALPLWKWLERAAQVVKQPVIRIAMDCQTNDMATSANNVLMFIYRYLLKTEDYNALPEEVKKRVLYQEKSIFWPVSRIVNPNHMVYLGRKDNKDLIQVLIHMHDTCVTPDKRVGSSSSYTMPADSKANRDFAEFLVRMYKTEGLCCETGLRFSVAGSNNL